jgi:hypothetical protein
MSLLTKFSEVNLIAPLAIVLPGFVELGALV